MAARMPGAAGPHGTLSNARRRRPDLGPLDRRNSLPTRLPRHLQPGHLARTGPGQEDRPFTPVPRHQRFHLQQGPAFRPARLRRGAVALSRGRRRGAKGEASFNRIALGPGAGDRRRPHAGNPQGVRRGGDSAHSPTAARTGCCRRTPPTPSSSAPSEPRASHATSAPHPTTAVTGALYGRMAGVAYEDYRHARLIVIWGANPSTSGFHLVPHVRQAARDGAAVDGHRSAPYTARQAGGHPSRGAARDRRGRRPGHPPVPLRARLRGRGVPRAVDATTRTSCAAARPSGRSSAPPPSPR